MATDISACFEVAVEVAKKAGEIILEAHEKEKQFDTKENFADLVTETDQRVEKFVFSYIKERFPDHSFIGEETVSAGQKCAWTDNPTWIIDPIDGTTNFIHSYPFSCISIGFTVNKISEVGVIFNPVTNSLYTARRGEGAFKNGQRIKVSNTKALIGGLVMSEYGNSRVESDLLKKIDNMRNVISHSHGIRSCGSAALSLCLVAEGAADAYFEYGIHSWDMAAGELIVREAGGVILDTTGGEFDLLSRRVLAANNKDIANEVGALIETIEYERD